MNYLERAITADESCSVEFSLLNGTDELHAGFTCSPFQPIQSLYNNAKSYIKHL